MTNEKLRMAGTKEEVVLRLLRGEDLESLSRETGCSPDELTKWLENYMKAGRESLDNAAHDPFNSEHLAMTAPTWNPWAQQGTWLPD